MYRPITVEFYKGTRNTEKLRIIENKSGCPKDLSNVTRMTISLDCFSDDPVLDSDIDPDRLYWEAEGIVYIDMPDIADIYYNKVYDVNLFAYDAVNPEPIALHHETQRKIRFKFL